VLQHGLVSLDFLSLFLSVFLRIERAGAGVNFVRPSMEEAGLIWNYLLG